MRFAGDRQMLVMALNMPALPELGNTSGFDFRLQDRGGLGYDRLVEARDELLARANADPNLAGVYFSGQADTPRLHVSIDREKAFSMGVPITEISNSLAVMFGSSYVGDFMHDSQVRRIIIQADGKSRLNGNDIEDLHVRNDQGKLLPLSSFVRLDWTAGPPQLTRYNNYPSFTINGSAAPGKSSGDAMKALEQITATLPQGVGFEWTGQSYEEQLAGSQATLLFSLSILIVFLVLAALYESWSIPLAVILVVPLGLLGALLAVFLRDMPNDIYFKVGLITTIGLSAKNAILIVEVAKEFYREGMGVMEATVTAAKLRLRPILMTSLAFGAGVVPLAFAHGAAAGAQRAVGTGVLGGIITATLLAIFLVPLFFRLTAGKRKPNHPEEA
jgi:hydrophobe/amphiphile efflux-1 (HAE1) family protein